MISSNNGRACFPSARESQRLPPLPEPRRSPSDPANGGRHNVT